MTTSDGRLSYLAVALDTSDWSEFEDWCDRFGGRVGVVKVGLEAYVRWGPEAVVRARATGARVFLDLKLHDIPNTVAAAVRAAVELGVSYLTVHASGGPRMLSAAVEAGGGQVGILAVTLLTHLDEQDLADLGLPGEGRARVIRWARLAATAGCAGIVCSPLEVRELRPLLPSAFEIVTPGIRLVDRTGDSVGDDDQRRVATPHEALAAGASLLVVGRPLTRSADPEVTLEHLAAAGVSALGQAPTR